MSNYAGEDAGGRIDVDTALVHSVSVVFVELGCEVGVGDVVRAATDAGIPAGATEKQGAVFLGGLDRGVSPLDMATLRHLRRRRGAGRALRHRRRGGLQGPGDLHPSPAGPPGLRRAPGGGAEPGSGRRVGSGTGRAARIGRPVAGKTGTTQDNVDAWFVGYVPQLSTAVWVGYDPRRPMADVHGRAVTGGSFPAAIFGDLMREGLRGVPVRRLAVAGPESLGLTILNPPPTTTLPAPLPTVEETTTTTGPEEGPATTSTTEEPVTTTTTRRRLLPPTTTTTTTRPAPTTTTTASTAAPTTTTTAMQGG